MAAPWQYTHPLVPESSMESAPLTGEKLRLSDGTTYEDTENNQETKARPIARIARVTPMGLAKEIRCQRYLFAVPFADS